MVKASPILVNFCIRNSSKMEKYLSKNTHYKIWLATHLINCSSHITNNINSIYIQLITNKSSHYLLTSHIYPWPTWFIHIAFAIVFLKFDWYVNPCCDMSTYSTWPPSNTSATASATISLSTSMKNGSIAACKRIQLCTTQHGMTRGPCLVDL